MRREIAGEAVLLSGYVFFTIVLLGGDTHRWLAVLGGVVVVLQALRLIRRVRRLRQGDTSASR